MDSRVIFKASKSLTDRISWTSKGPDPSSEWSYLGLKDDFKQDILESTVNKLFGQSTVLFAFEKDNSQEIISSDVVQHVKKVIGSSLNSIFLWDQGFETVLEISNTGVFRYGKKL